MHLEYVGKNLPRVGKLQAAIAAGTVVANSTCEPHRVDTTYDLVELRVTEFHHVLVQHVLPAIHRSLLCAMSVSSLAVC